MTNPGRRNPPATRAARRGFLLLIVILLFLAMMLAVPSAAPADIGIRVTPTHLTLTVPLGGQTRESIQLQNLSPGPVTIVALGDDAGSDSLAGIQLDPGELSLQPGQNGVVSVNISLPADAATGNTHHVVKIEAKPEQSRDVAIVGEVDVSIDIEAIQPVSDPTWSYPMLVDSSDSVVFGMSGLNTAGFPTRLTGTVDISGLLFGSAHLQGESRQVADGGRSQLSTVWDDPPLFGIKRVTLALNAGAGAPLEKSILLFVFPWKILLAAFLIGLSCLAGFRLAGSFRAL